MSQDAENKNQVYHIDADVLLNYQWYDDQDQHRSVQSLFNKANPGDLKIKINTFALGEVFQKIIKKYPDKYLEIKKLIDLLNNNRLEIFELKNIKINDLINEIKILRDKDKIINNGDIINIAIFLLDSEATIFKTFDIKCLESEKIRSYIKQHNNKNIKGFEENDHYF
jgi:predicted nucleic acid-binding protein